MKLLGILAACLFLVLGGAYGYFKMRKPDQAPAPNLRIERTPERIARGKYIFHSVGDCAGCHSPRDASRLSMPVIEAKAGSGMIFPKELGFPGTIVSPNLTPDPETGLGNWTDGEIVRAIREGVDRNGNALFAFMPYGNFRHMSDEDVYSVVAYIRTLPPVKNPLPRTRLDFPVDLLNTSAPKPVNGPVPQPSPADKLAYGKYLVTLASCGGCHTKMDKGSPLPGMAFGGGEEFRVGPYLVRSANISPDESSGIGAWGEDRFVAKFRNYRGMDAGRLPATTQANFTLMPWLGFSQLTDEDLSAIYAYLRTVQPVANPVEVHPTDASPQTN